MTRMHSLNSEGGRTGRLFFARRGASWQQIPRMAV